MFSFGNVPLRCLKKTALKTLFHFGMRLKNPKGCTTHINARMGIGMCKILYYSPSLRMTNSNGEGRIDSNSD